MSNTKNINEDISTGADNIDEMILILQKIREKHGNLRIMGEYDAHYYFGASMEVSEENNPDDYLGDKITVLFIS